MKVPSLNNFSLPLLRDLTAFLMNGQLNNFPYVVMLSGAQAILPGLTGGVLLCNILPTVLIKTTAPFYMHNIPYTIRILLIFLTSFLSFYIVAWGPHPLIKLLGVVVASIGAGLGEITFLAMVSFYDKNCVSSWSMGTGVAGISGSLSYLVLVSVLDFTPQAAMMIVSIMPPFLLLSNFIILTGKHNKGRKFFGLLPDPNVPKSPKAEVDVDIRDYDQSAEDQLSEISEKSQLILQEDEYASQIGQSGQSGQEELPLTLKEKIMCIFPLLKYMIPLFVVFYSEYVINTGIAPRITFTKGFIRPEDDYKYYTFIYSLGVFISRSSVNIVPITHNLGLWIMAFTQFFFMIFFFIDAYFRLIPFIYITFAIIFVEGLLGGACYVNAFYQIQTKLPTRVREFSMGLCSVADSTGIAFSALTALVIEPWLKEHQYVRDI